MAGESADAVIVRAHGYAMDRQVPHSPLDGRRFANIADAVAAVLIDAQHTRLGSGWSEAEFRMGYWTEHPKCARVWVKAEKVKA